MWILIIFFSFKISEFPHSSKYAFLKLCISVLIVWAHSFLCWILWCTCPFCHQAFLCCFSPFPPLLIRNCFGVEHLESLLRLSVFWIMKHPVQQHNICIRFYSSNVALFLKEDGWCYGLEWIWTQWLSWVPGSATDFSCYLWEVTWF